MDVPVRIDGKRIRRWRGSEGTVVCRLRWTELINVEVVPGGVGRRGRGYALLPDPETDTTSCGHILVVLWHDTAHEVRSVCYPVDASFSFSLYRCNVCRPSLPRGAQFCSVCSVFELNPQARRQKFPRCKQFVLYPNALRVSPRF